MRLLGIENWELKTNPLRKKTKKVFSHTNPEKMQNLQSSRKASLPLSVGLPGTQRVGKTSKMTFQPNRIIIFTRYPAPGTTKTRLIPSLGPVGAADLQRSLTETVYKKALSFAAKNRTSVEICVKGGNEKKMRTWLGMGFEYSLQAPGDLGEGMQAAFSNAFRGGSYRVILLGTDIPELEEKHLEKGFQALEENDLVLGPSTDGGYYLVGLCRLAAIFKGISWGQPEVLAQTVALARKEGLSLHTLEPLTDIDRPQDLDILPAAGIWKSPYVSVIIPTLNERPNIEKAMVSAVDADTEILVVDGGSRDDTVAIARKAGARVETGKRGRAAQQNFGASVASGRVLLFLHADTRLPAGYPTHIFNTFMDPRVALGAFRFKTDSHTPMMKLITFGTNLRARYLKMPYGDQALFIRKSTFDFVGGFPEMPLSEDLFLVRRIRKENRIGIASADAVTSARRWDRLGPLKTTLRNQIILAGLCLKISPRTLASIYGRKF